MNIAASLRAQSRGQQSDVDVGDVADRLHWHNRAGSLEPSLTFGQLVTA